MGAEVEVRVAVPCSRCNGSGHDPHMGGASVSIGKEGVTTHQSWQSPCLICGGKGQRPLSARLVDPEAVLRTLLEAEAVSAEHELTNGHPGHLNVCLRFKAEAIRKVLEWLDVPLPPRLAPASPEEKP